LNLTAMGMPQHLVLVLDGFHAMSIYNEIVEDGEAATSLIRKRLSKQMCLQVFSEVEWLHVEQKVWEFLVHKEFEVRRLPYFQVQSASLSSKAALLLSTHAACTVGSLEMFCQAFTLTGTA
jgi:hypothetical protein